MTSTHSMQKETTAVLDRSLFDQAESEILSEITQMTKSLLHTFKFQMIYHARVSPEAEARTLQVVKEYRKEKKNHQDYLKEVFSSQ